VDLQQPGAAPGARVKVLDDFDFTQRISEKAGELDAAAWAENNGWLVRKMQYAGRHSCPDRLFAGYGQLFLIEMKKRGKTPSKDGKLSKGQVLEFERYAVVGVTVHVFYTGEDAIAFLKSKMPVTELLV
jgi:formate dehydrogenase assembly factor FdhD